MARAEVIESFRAYLRDHNLPVTAQRSAIAAVVLGADRHLSAEEVAQELARRGAPAGTATVYRTLEVLEELGLVRHTHLSDRAPTYHSTREHEHVHAVCRRCHSVRSYDPAVVAPLVAALGEDGFTVDVGHLAIFGVCADCASGDPT